MRIEPGLFKRTQSVTTAPLPTFLNQHKYAITLAIIHLLFAFVYHITWFSNGNQQVWDNGWQTLPMDSLRSNFIESIWYLHAQPPLFNMEGALFGTVFYPHHMAALYWFQVAMGVITAVLAYYVALVMLKNPPAAFGAALLLVALNPSILLYENLIFYTIQVTFLLTTAAFWLSRFAATQKIRYLYAFVIFINLIILMRTLYHLIFLVPVFILVGILAKSQWRRVLVVAIMISLVSFGWYAKNLAVFGFFGASSWSGSNYWKMVRANYSYNRLQHWAAEGEIDAVAADLPPFSPPSLYQDYGFQRQSDIDVLSQDNFHNINMLAISDTYQADALHVIRLQPKHYLRNMLYAYKRFFDTPYNYSKEVAPSGIVFHIRISEELLYGQALAHFTNETLGLSYPSWLVILVPGLLLGFGVSLLLKCRWRWRAWLAAIQNDPVMVFCALIIVYTTSVSTMFEYGENNRFKVMIEPLLWLFMVTVIFRGLRLLVFRIGKWRVDER